MQDTIVGTNIEGQFILFYVLILEFIFLIAPRWLVKHLCSITTNCRCFVVVTLYLYGVYPHSQFYPLIKSCMP